MVWDKILLLPPQSRCTCKLGFAGDGYQCSPIDPCRVGNGGCHGLVRGDKGFEALGRLSGEGWLQRGMSVLSTCISLNSKP